MMNRETSYFKKPLNFLFAFFSAGSKMKLGFTCQIVWHLRHFMLFLYEMRAAFGQRNPIPNYQSTVFRWFQYLSVKFSWYFCKARLRAKPPAIGSRGSWRSELILATACCGLLQPYQEFLGNWESETGKWRDEYDMGSNFIDVHVFIITLIEF